MTKPSGPQQQLYQQLLLSSGYQIPLHYKKFEIPSAPSKIVALSETEFYKFLTVDLPKSEQVTRDLFCFSAFTGLRYSDVVRITNEMIDGHWLEITTKKTEEPLRVYLLPEALTILKKYNNRFKGLRTNQGSNKGVKRIARLAGMNAAMSGDVTMRVPITVAPSAWGIRAARSRTARHGSPESATGK